MLGFIPAALLNVYGQPVAKGTYNSETLIQANHDGSVAEPLATGPPAGASVIPQASSKVNDIYCAYVAPSLWTQL